METEIGIVTISKQKTVKFWRIALLFELHFKALFGNILAKHRKSGSEFCKIYLEE